MERICDSADLKRQMFRDIEHAALKTKLSIQRVHGHLRHVFRVPSIYFLSRLLMSQCEDELHRLATGRILLPAKRAKTHLALVRRIDEKQMKLPEVR